MDYDTARGLAGSIGTVFLVLSFLGVVLFAFRPGSKRIHQDSADIPFRHDDRPSPQGGDDRPAPVRRDKPAADLEEARK